MNVVLNPELEELIQSQLDTGKYENVEAVLKNADFLITGDRDFTEVETLGNTQIVSVSGFLDRISEEGQD